MVQSKAATVTAYLRGLPPDRRKDIEAVRKVIKQNLPQGFRETMDFGMINYVVPLPRFPGTYNGKPLCYAALAAQKGYNTAYLMDVYGDKATEKWFHDAYRASGKKLEMGRSCVRFRSADDLPLDVIGAAVARTSLEDFVSRYQRLKAAAKVR